MFIDKTSVKIKFAMPWYRNFFKHVEGFCVSLCKQWNFINMGDMMIYIMWDISKAERFSVSLQKFGLLFIQKKPID